MARTITSKNIPNIERDTELNAPGVTVINASAGAGKTHILTLRLIQFLLSPNIHKNGLRNILAITFTKNAAGEMKQRVLEYLKRIALGEKARLDEFAAILDLEPAELQSRAAEMLDHIFDRYSDLQIQTIDSFMTSVFKAAAPELGVAPEFSVALDNTAMLAEAFDLHLRSLDPSSDGARVLADIAATLGALRKDEQSFAWNPSSVIAAKMSPLYTLLGAQTKPLHTPADLETLGRLRQDIQMQVRQVDAMATESGFEKKVYFQKMAEAVAGGNVDYLLDHALSEPLKKPATKALREKFDQYIAMLEPEMDEIRKLLADFAMARARTQVIPYSRTLEMLRGALSTVARRKGAVFLEDIHSLLQRNLDAQVVPEVYFTLGETIFHFLIDEFQDTSPIQWSNIRLLVENVLATEGTLFVVGDTKQSIYGFRGADWTIMDRLAREPEFPSAAHAVRSLDTNYRSGEKIIRFVEQVFHECVPATDYAPAAEKSGLSSFVQHVLPKNAGKGYVEVHRFDLEAGETEPDRTKTLEILTELAARGYRYGDMAILTPANDTVIAVSGWLSDAGIPVISHSSLDVRRRRSAGEILGLLQFLDSPIDNLAFARFVLGGLFAAALRHDSNATTHEALLGLFESDGPSREEPAYIQFREQFPELWERYFERLYNVVGYLPLYDLLTEVIKTFALFDAAPMEEATLVKILEVARQFEGTGQNSLKKFLQAAVEEEEGEAWEINVPDDIDAVTVMTVHKSKGLQFPAVIVLLQDKYEKRIEYHVAQGEDSVELLHITKTLAGHNPVLQQIYDTQREKERVNFLNGLYVAFTRAEAELYVISLFKKEPKIPSSFLPAGYGPGKKPAAAGRTRTGYPQAGHRHQIARVPETPSRAQAFSQAEVRRGEMLHELLSTIEYADGLGESELDALIDRHQIPAAERSAIRATLKDFLEHDAMRHLFISRSGRLILNEQELAGSGGALFRADRIVVDPEEVTIVDFKTGSDAEADAHDRQVRNYMSILRQVYEGKTVKGIVAYIDLRKVRAVQ